MKGASGSDASQLDPSLGQGKKDGHHKGKHKKKVNKGATRSVYILF